jgi:hypothetical protein
MAETYAGKVLENNGCYTNFGNVQHTTRRLNNHVLTVGVDDKAITVVPETKDAKLSTPDRPMAATYAPQVTCPPSCKFYPKIQGDIGGELRIQVQIDAAIIEAKKIDALCADVHCRLHVVGDASNLEAVRIISDAMNRYEARSPNGSMAYTYTHAWDEPYSVPESAWQGARVLASCESDADIKRARAMGYACEITYPQHIARKIHQRGETVVLPCPNNFNKDVTCSMCMKCADIDLLKTRNWAIGLETHGAFRKANAAIAG